MMGWLEWSGFGWTKYYRLYPDDELGEMPEDATHIEWTHDGPRILKWDGIDDDI
jgi:hypothetical protein